MAETMNMMEISVDRFIELIKDDLEDENYDPIMGIGKSGVGKTMSVYELTQELGIGFCELRLVNMTEIDIIGIPTIEDGRTTYAANSLLPDVKRDGERGILVLDEITSCNSTIRAAAYQLLDSKRALGTYKLPEKWKIVALGNGIEDGGVYSGMEHAFVSRATCYRIEPNLNSWLKWAVKKGVNPSIIAFLHFDPTKLHDMNADEIASVFPCPRSWVALSKKLNKREERQGGFLPLDKVELYASGAVGFDVAASFAAFYAYNSKTISADDILSGKLDGSAINGVDTQVVLLTLQALIKQLNTEINSGIVGFAEFKDEVINRTANVVNWVLDVAKYKLDYSVMFLTDLASGVKAFGEMVLLNNKFDEVCPGLLEFAAEHGILFNGADDKVGGE